MRSFLCLIAVTTLVGPGCTQVTQNFPDGGCEPGSLQCVGGDLGRCLEDGTQLVVFKQCAADSPCGGTPPSCNGAVIGGGPSCESDEECETQLGDLGTCREAWCDGGQCRSRTSMDGTLCDDLNACTETDACAAGICTGALISCTTEDQCKKIACDSGSGCVESDNDGAACNDELPCTADDICSAGVCAGVTVDCDDGSDCTEDICDAATGVCQYLPQHSQPCDDGDECTVDDKCDGTSCTGQPACECDTVDDCAQFNDENPCTADYDCLSDYCTPAPETAIQCDDTGLGACQANECTYDAEAKTAECVLTELGDGSPCNDTSDCTIQDTCVQGACIGQTDNTIPGCGFFRIGWYSVGSQSMTWELPGQILLKGSAGLPFIRGTATDGANYRVRAIVPGL